MATFQAELTDTVAGEANGSWVKRKTFTLPDDASDLAIVRAGKAALGLNGVRCRTENHGDSFTLRPCGACVIAFITYQED